VRAGGGLLWSLDPSGPGSGPVDGAAAPEPRIALVHRRRYNDWSLPKGKLDVGEHPLQAACREVREETGVLPVAGLRLPSTTYLVSTRAGEASKVVDYWAMRAGETGGFVPNDEIAAVAWLPPAAARDRLTYRHDIAVVNAWTRLPPVTATLLLIRHGRAGSRGAWTDPDDVRPLDAKGLRQAARVAEVLVWYRPSRVMSVDKLRCVDTVRPLANALSVPIESVGLLSEESHADDPERGAEVVADLAESAAGPSARPGVLAVCSQGGVIPDSVELLAEAAGVALDVDGERVPAKKGSVWVLSFSGRQLVAADYLPTLEAPDADR
jgi:8-oxo-dGTP pyrophosphatase MutT (NUDIX family)/broad specificity phosphatase PhoE